jgi:hypothetical protein
MSRRAYNLRVSAPSVEDFFSDLRKLVTGKKEHEIKADKRDYLNLSSHIKQEIRSTYLNPTWQHMHDFKGGSCSNTGILDNLWMWRPWDPADAIAYQLKAVDGAVGFFNTHAVPYLRDISKLADEIARISEPERAIDLGLSGLQRITFPGSRLPSPRLLGGQVYDNRAWERTGTWDQDLSLKTTWEKGQMSTLGPKNFRVAAEGIIQLVDAFERYMESSIPQSDLTQGSWRGDALSGSRDYEWILKQLNTDGGRPGFLIDYHDKHALKLTDTAQALERWLSRSFK